MYIQMYEQASQGPSSQMPFQMIQMIRIVRGIHIWNTSVFLKHIHIKYIRLNYKNLLKISKYFFYRI